MESKKPGITIETSVIRDDEPVLFNEYNPNWSPQIEYNIMFLRSTQNYLNDRYRTRGHMFLNEVYDALGFDRTPAGAVLGWIFGEGEDIVIDWELRDDNIFPITFNPLGVIFDQI